MKFEKRATKIKRNLSNFSSFDAYYEDIAARPATFLNQVIEKIGASNNFESQPDNEFYIDPSQLHLVAGNPMRYKGKQKVIIDENWENELTSQELKQIQQLKKW